MSSYYDKEDEIDWSDSPLDEHPPPAPRAPRASRPSNPTANPPQQSTAQAPPGYRFSLRDAAERASRPPTHHHPQATPTPSRASQPTNPTTTRPAQATQPAQTPLQAGATLARASARITQLEGERDQALATASFKGRRANRFQEENIALRRENEALRGEVADLERKVDDLERMITGGRQVLRYE